MAEVFLLLANFSERDSMLPNGLLRSTCMGYIIVGISIVARAEDAMPKLPIPRASAQAEVTKSIKDVYGKKIADAKNVKAKQELAAEFVQLAKESKEQAERYVLLKLAIDLASQCPDAQNAAAAIDELSHIFEVDALELKFTAISKSSGVATSVQEHKSLASVSSKTADDAVAADNYAKAEQLQLLAVNEAKKSRDEGLINQTSKRSAEIKELAKTFDSIKGSVEKLKTTPLDAAANLTVGRFRCFYKADWDGGLTFLALADDKSVHDLASSDLTSPGGAEDQFGLANRWWDFAQKLDPLPKRVVEERACYWYDKAMPGLKGLAKAKAEKRLADFAALTKTSSTKAPVRTKHWVVLFRSSSPEIWNTDTNDKRGVAISLDKAPKDVKFLKMQIDASRVIIIPVTNDALSGTTSGEKIGWEGENKIAWGGRQLGIFGKSIGANNPGDVVVKTVDPQTGGRSGWGFGFRGIVNVQGWAWAGKSIPDAAFEISVTSDELSPSEAKNLVR